MAYFNGRTTMTVPLIDGIDSDNFEYRPVYQGNTHFRGIFEWGMLYKENEVPDQEAKTRSFNSEPYRYGLIKMIYLHYSSCNILYI